MSANGTSRTPYSKTQLKWIILRYKLKKFIKKAIPIVIVCILPIAIYVIGFNHGDIKHSISRITDAYADFSENSQRNAIINQINNDKQRGPRGSYSASALGLTHTLTFSENALQIDATQGNDIKLATEFYTYVISDDGSTIYFYDYGKIL